MLKYPCTFASGKCLSTSAASIRRSSTRFGVQSAMFALLSLARVAIEPDAKLSDHLALGPSQTPVVLGGDQHAPFFPALALDLLGIATLAAVTLGESSHDATAAFRVSVLTVGRRNLPALTSRSARAPMIEAGACPSPCRP